jgi:hypothetical protein
MEPMIVLTVKRDGGAQDVLGFYRVDELVKCMTVATQFLADSKDSRRAIVRVEIYNPAGDAPETKLTAELATEWKRQKAMFPP